MNGKNSCQSLVSKERLLDFALHANSGNGPLSNKKFPARILPFNARNATHFAYL